jgi:hypothetical protein
MRLSHVTRLPWCRSRWSIYALNVLQKTGAPWKNGTADYYALHQRGMLTFAGSWLGSTLSLSAIRVLTFGALGIEASVAVLLLVPVKTRFTRMLAWLLVCCLHLSIASVLHLGTFSWAMVILFIALVPREAWERLGASLSARRPARHLLVDASSPLAIAACRVIKRFDNFGKIRFVASEGADVGRYVVVDPNTERRSRGVPGLASLARALPLGSAMAALLRVPGFTRVARRAIRRGERNPEYWAQYFELPELSATREATQARLFVARIKWLLGEALVVVLLVCCTSQLLVENQVVPTVLKPAARPIWMTAVITYPRLFQGWSMFAPAPPLDDVMVVVDGRTRDGRHFDPLTGFAPSFDVAARGQRSRNCEWYYFERHLSEARFQPYLGGLRDFLKTHHEITGHPEDALVAFDVWSVSEPIALPGEPKGRPVKSKILSYGFVRD